MSADPSTLKQNQEVYDTSTTPSGSLAAPSNNGAGVLEEDPKSPLEALDEALSLVGMPRATTIPVPPPRSSRLPPTPALAGLNKSKCGRPESECTEASYGTPEDASCLPDKHRSLHMPIAPLESKKLSKKMMAKGPAMVMSDELHDYSEIYTPSNEERIGAWGDTESMSAESSGGRTGSGDSGLTGLSSTGTDVGGGQAHHHHQLSSSCSSKPPPPPLHRYPSWEDRIYQVASDGFPKSQQESHEAKGSCVDGAADCRNNNPNRNSASLCGNGYGNDVSIPVYATVKGVRTSNDRDRWWLVTNYMSVATRSNYF